MELTLSQATKLCSFPVLSPLTEDALGKKTQSGLLGISHQLVKPLAGSIHNIIRQSYLLQSTHIFCNTTFFPLRYLSTFFLIVFTNFTASFAPIIRESITFSIKDRHLYLHSKSLFLFLLQVIHFSKCSHFTNRGAVPGHPGVDHLLQHASVSRVLSALNLRRM